MSTRNTSPQSNFINATVVLQDPHRIIHTAFPSPILCAATLATIHGLRSIGCDPDNEDEDSDEIVMDIDLAELMMDVLEFNPEVEEDHEEDISNTDLSALAGEEEKSHKNKEDITQQQQLPWPYNISHPKLMAQYEALPHAAKLNYHAYWARFIHEMESAYEESLATARYPNLLTHIQSNIRLIIGGRR